MWKKLSVSLAAAALAACCPLSADDGPCESAKCHDGKKGASCPPAMTVPCAMQSKDACCTNRKVVKITPVRRASEQDPGFIAVLEEYSVTTEVPVQGQNPAAPGAGKPEVTSK